MGAFQSRFDETTKVLTHVAIAPVNAGEIVRCAVDWFHHLKGREYHALWDLRKQPLRVEIGEVVSGLKQHLAWLNEHRRGQRHAYVVDSRVAMYLARPLKARIRLEWDVFDDEDLAREWLRTGDPIHRRPADPLAPPA
ncbi:MAG TPA: hypothetical protein VMW17_09280 [Candidatus Binatia bacterium]|nr:hypothetical protein [Candidatus Binatia bacterium]